MTSLLFADRRRIAHHLLQADGSLAPGHLLDQLSAAHRDVMHRWFLPALPAFAARGGRSIARPLIESLETQEMLLAAALDCQACTHLRRARGPLPVVVALALRLARCDRCARTLRTPPADEADRCDVCGSRGNAIFTPFRAVAAGAVYIGDAGECCAPIVLAGVAAP